LVKVEKFHGKNLLQEVQMIDFAFLLLLFGCSFF
jgi:hypothetical protein